MLTDEIFKEQYESIKGLNNRDLKKVIKNSNWNFIIQIIRYLEIRISELSKWDTNKDTRNSRQRVANGKLIKQIEILKKENEKLKENRDKAIDFIQMYNRNFNDDISKEVIEILSVDK